MWRQKIFVAHPSPSPTHISLTDDKITQLMIRGLKVSSIKKLLSRGTINEPMKLEEKKIS